MPAQRSLGLLCLLATCLSVDTPGACLSCFQYGGSGAMHRVEEAEGAIAGQRDLMLTGGAKNALVAVQRYYSNNVTDYERQQVRSERRSESSAPRDSTQAHS